MKKNMKKNLTVLIFLFVITSILLPVLPAVPVVQAAAGVPPYRVGVAAPVGDWDPTITPGWSLQTLFFYPITVETPAAGRYDFNGGITKPIEDEWFPVLATDFSIEYWPSENNSLGWNNTGGVMTSTWTLRQGVKFHDGSNWNATVLKWNIDRMYLIVGNQTGNGDMRNFDYYYPEVVKTENTWTPSWNLSDFDKPALGAPGWSTPPNSDYVGYYIGNGTKYPGVNDVDGWVRNPAPWGGYSLTTGDPIHFAPYDRYPLMRYVEILNDQESGGTIKLHYNSWNSYAGEGGAFFDSLSYTAYSQNYTGQGIYGYQNGVKDDKNPTIVDHMIGTGPYTYEFSDEDGGYMLKFNDYWNRTALEAEGLYDIERVNIINFPTSPAGALAQNNALISHALDAVGDSSNMPMDTQAIKDDPNINYYEAPPSNYLTQITLNSINETWWAWPGAEPGYDYIDTGDINGIPRVLRKAINYAFDYDHMIDVELEGKAVRSGGVVGVNSIYFNASVSQPNFNITYARELLLTTESDTSGEVFNSRNIWQGYTPDPDLYNFSKRTAERFLDENSTDSEWRAVAEGSDPVWTVDYYWDSWHEPLKDEFQAALYSLGVGITDPIGTNNRVPERIWDVVQIYWESTFDGTHSIWSAGAWPMDFWMPDTTPEAWIDFMLRDPDLGRWRNQALGWGLAGITSWWPTWNFGFTYDAEIDGWIDRMFMSSPDQKVVWISKIQNKQQNENYPFLYAYQSIGGNAIWDTWNISLYVHPRSGKLVSLWGDPGGMYSYSLINYRGPVSTAPLIPGFSLFMTITVSVASILGVAYLIMRKKKLR